MIGQKEINADAFGVIVKLFTKDGKVITKEVDGGSGQASQSSKILYFGLGEETSFEKIEIYWSKEKIQTVSNLQMNQVNTISWSKQAKKKGNKT